MDMSNAVISFPLLGENFKLNPPTGFTLFGRTFYWYGVIIAVGVVLAAIYMIRSSRRFGLTKDNAIDILLCAIIPGIVGARLYYCLFSDDLSDYLANPITFLHIWEGGLAIYGGLIFGVAGICIYAKIKKFPIGTVLDASAAPVLIGQCVGRWGNLINREAFGVTVNSFGSVIDTNVPWKMGLTLDGSTQYVHPTFLYESLWNLVGLVIVHFLSKKRKYDGQIFVIYLGWYGLGRMMIEGLRADSLYLTLFGESFRVSKLLATVCMLAAILFLLYNWLFKKHDASDLYVNRLAHAVQAADAEDMNSDEGEVNIENDGPENALETELIEPEELETPEMLSEEIPAGETETAVPDGEEQ